MRLICTLTFEHEGHALQAAIRLKSPIHSRKGRMKLDPNPVNDSHHDILVYAQEADAMPALERFMMEHNWSHYDGLRDLEPAELTL